MTSNKSRTHVQSDLDAVAIAKVNAFHQSLGVREIVSGVWPESDFSVAIVETTVLVVVRA